jgi:hypothetical protein
VGGGGLLLVQLWRKEAGLWVRGTPHRVWEGWRHNNGVLGRRRAPSAAEHAIREAPVSVPRLRPEGRRRVIRAPVGQQGRGCRPLPSPSHTTPGAAPRTRQAPAHLPASDASRQCRSTRVGIQGRWKHWWWESASAASMPSTPSCAAAPSRPCPSAALCGLALSGRASTASACVCRWLKDSTVGMRPPRCGLLTLLAAADDSPANAWPSASAAPRLPRKLLGDVTVWGSRCAASGETAGTGGVLHAGAVHTAASGHLATAPAATGEATALAHLLLPAACASMPASLVAAKAKGLPPAAAEMPLANAAKGEWPVREGTRERATGGRPGGTPSTGSGAGGAAAGRGSGAGSGPGTASPWAR